MQIKIANAIYMYMVILLLLNSTQHNYEQLNLTYKYNIATTFSLYIVYHIVNSISI